jgi:hypothetical protein
MFPLRVFLRGGRNNFLLIPEFSIKGGGLNSKIGSAIETDGDETSINDIRQPWHYKPTSLVPQNSRSRRSSSVSTEHKELFCRFFIDTHIAFDPAAIQWPELDEGSLKFLHSLPVWSEAMETERLGTCTIQSCAAVETDPLIREAVTLLAQEEARHAAIIQSLTRRYGILIANLPSPVSPVDGEWEFPAFRL